MQILCNSVHKYQNAGGHQGNIGAMPSLTTRGHVLLLQVLAPEGLQISLVVVFVVPRVHSGH